MVRVCCGDVRAMQLSEGWKSVCLNCYRARGAPLPTHTTKVPHQPPRPLTRDARGAAARAAVAQLLLLVVRQASIGVGCV